MNTKNILSLLLILLFTDIAHAQFIEKLGKRAQKAAERTVEKRVDKETEKKTDKTLDGVFEPGEEKQKDKNDKKGGSDPETASTAPDSEETAVAFNYDFEPGNIALFEDDFSKDRTGDFPAKWDTNGSGEIVTVEGQNGSGWQTIRCTYQWWEKNYLKTTPFLLIC